MGRMMLSSFGLRVVESTVRSVAVVGHRR